MPDAATFPSSSSSAAEAKVDTRSYAYMGMAPRWELISSLLSGTDEMRAKRERYLPKEEREQQSDYNVRVAHSFLFPGLKDAIQKLSSKPFGKPVVIELGMPLAGEVLPELPEQVRELERDVDGQGTSLTQFAKEWFETSMSYGLGHVLVDYPQLERALNLAETREARVHPYLCLIRAPDLIGWRYERRLQPAGGELEGGGPDQSGQPSTATDEYAWRLTQVRILETRVEPVGLYGEEKVDCIRVITPTTWELWKKKKGDAEFIRAESGTHTLGRIPLVTLYLGTRTGVLQAEPPLWTLAETNLAHWQSDSDQRNALRFARFNLLFGKGIPEQDLNKPIGIGPSAVYLTTTTTAEITVVGQQQAGGLALGKEDVEELKERMEMLALQPLISTPGNPTATGKAIDESKAHASILAWVKNLEAALETCYRIAAEWVEVELPAKFSVDVFSDFGLSIKATEDVQALIQMRVAREITRETFLREVKRRGVLSDMVDVELEAKRVETEDPGMGLPFPGSPNQPPPEGLGMKDEESLGADGKPLVGAAKAAAKAAGGAPKPGEELEREAPEELAARGAKAARRGAA